MVLKRKVISVILLIFFLALASTVYSAVLINEILANGLSDPEHEWVELFNNGSSSINLTNWRISESFSSNFTFNITMSANEFIILAVDFNTFNATYPKINQSGIKIIDITITNFNLADTSGEVKLYNSSGALVDLVAYVQASGKTFENVSVGRYPDGSSGFFNLSTLTPGAKNDNQAPKLNKWVNPPRNSTNLSGLANVIVNITDDTTPVNSTSISFNGTNFSMSKNGNFWEFLWNTSLNPQKLYNITVFFNDSYGKSGSDTLFGILVNNSPRISAFSPAILTQTLAEGSTLSFNVNASDPDDAITFSWYIDNVLNSTNPSNFSYTPSFSDNGTHTINSTIKDSSLNQVSIKWTITVTNVNRAPALDAVSSKRFSKNINSSFNITASDLDNDILTFSSNHSRIAVSKANNSLAVVSWKPANLDLGSNVINFTASDSSLADFEIITIAVNYTNNMAPNITTPAKTTAIVNEQYGYDADATDADNDTLFFSLKTNASGMSIDSSSGLISFNPPSKGFFSVNASVSDFIEIANQSFFLEAVHGTRLKISDVDIKVGSKKSSNMANNTRIGREAEPESKVELKITVKNDFTKSEDIDIEGIEVKATIEEIDDDDDLEEESQEFDLRAENDRTVTLRFSLPLNIDDGIFDVLIEADGNDENGNSHGQFFNLRLEVEKENHDLRLSGFDLSPATVNCNRDIKAEYKIINVGAEDEENAVFELKSADLGVLISEKNISVDSGTEDNVFSKSSRFKISREARNGAYQIAASVYTDDGKLHDTKTKEIKVEDCIALRQKSEQQVVLIAPPESSPTEAGIREIKAPAIEISFKEADGGMRLLVLSTFIFTSFFVFTAIILYAKL